MAMILITETAALMPDLGPIVVIAIVLGVLVMTLVLTAKGWVR